jgi:hypothetical protein
MIVITGDTRAKNFVNLLQKFGWGRMVINRRIIPYPQEPWGFDNGAYRDFLNSKSFDRDRYMRALNKAIEIAEKYHPPYLAVLPDEVGTGMRSLELSLKWLDTELSDIDFNWYLAVQDGMELGVIEEILESYPRIKGVFLGGTDRFKPTARVWSSLAHKYGKSFHYARAGTRRKIAHANLAEADSIDSALPLWIKERLRKFIDSIRTDWKKQRQQFLFDELYLSEIHLRSMRTLREEV